MNVLIVVLDTHFISTYNCVIVTPFSLSYEVTLIVNIQEKQTEK